MLARDHCLAPDRVVDAPIYGGRYGRMFADLPPLSRDEGFLHMIGSAGGACDGTPSDSAVADDASIAAGWPFLGQFVAHDITADRSPLRSHTEADTLRNFRTPRLNLECLYGGGPVGSPYLYRSRRSGHVPARKRRKRRPANSEGLALIGDPRNDVHLFVNQLHVAFLHAHNVIVDRLRERRRPRGRDLRGGSAGDDVALPVDPLAGLPPAASSAKSSSRSSSPTARATTRLHGEPYIPFEFADAAFRTATARSATGTESTSRVPRCRCSRT